MEPEIRHEHKESYEQLQGYFQVLPPVMFRAC